MNVSENTRSRLAELLKPYIVRGVTNLSGGGQSDWYVDCRPVTMGRQGRWCTNAILELISGSTFDSVGGPAVGAIPLATTVGEHSGTRSFGVRKRAKSHGYGGLIFGAFHSGDSVLLVDDVATTAESLTMTAEAVQLEGGQVAAVAVLVARLGATRAWASQGIYPPLLSVLTPIDLGVEE